MHLTISQQRIIRHLYEHGPANVDKLHRDTADTAIWKEDFTYANLQTLESNDLIRPVGDDSHGYILYYITPEGHKYASTKQW